MKFEHRAIKRIREGRGLTQTECAKRLYRSRQWWSQVENGDRNLTIATFLKIAGVLRVKDPRPFLFLNKQASKQIQKMNPTDAQMLIAQIKEMERQLAAIKQLAISMLPPADPKPPKGQGDAGGARVRVT
jgi:transcriptional regulator with XRE-family HTH domain